MLAPNLKAADFAKGLKSLLPRGRVWPRDNDTTQNTLWQALGLTFERHNARVNNLLVDAFPLTTIELLPEWEKTLGLPDPCAGLAPTIEARRAQVIARLTSTGGQAIAYFIQFAANLGYTITVTNDAPFRVGWNCAGDPLKGQAWAFVWYIHAPLNTVTYFRVGSSAVGEPLAYWSNAVLECEFQSIKPAHSIVLFEYT